MFPSHVYENVKCEVDSTVFRGVYHYKNACFYSAMMSRKEGGLLKFRVV